MQLHILGICGTFMGGLAVLARAVGHEVRGSDRGVYPPMSRQLEDLGIPLLEGYCPEHLQPAPEQVIIGNALSRGNPAVEHVLNEGLPYVSGPQWLAEQVLRGREVVAVAGTHGKTTIASMLVWILEEAGLQPGFLIGGVPRNFGVSARLGEGAAFVVEADEYDSAFFDKRSKFVHYRPRTLVLSNLEFDHADIFPDLAAIKRQFHHLLRTVPGQGLIVCNAGDAELADVLAMGCWTPVESFSASAAAGPLWNARAAAGGFTLHLAGEPVGRVAWELAGRHNVENALAAIAAARHLGVDPRLAADALARFKGVKRRMEVVGRSDGITLYDDFAHHPTEIAATIDAARERLGPARIVAVLEPRSNTMKLGLHTDRLPDSLAGADLVCLFQPSDLGWDLQDVARRLGPQARVFADLEALLKHLLAVLCAGDQVLIMSNGGFGGLHGRLLRALDARSGEADG